MACVDLTVKRIVAETLEFGRTVQRGRTLRDIDAPGSSQGGNTSPVPMTCTAIAKHTNRFTNPILHDSSDGPSSTLEIDPHFVGLTRPAHTSMRTRTGHARHPLPSVFASGPGAG